MSYPKFTKPTDYAKGGPKKNKKSSGPKPSNPSLWSRAKALAKEKFEVYPSAYANGWASKWYKEHGGTWSDKKAAGGMINYQGGGPQPGDLMEIQNGGTHEESPLGGVPMGMNADGQQVLVEEGETVQKETQEGVDFVFSDRIKITKQIANEFKLPIRFVGKSFAEASKTIDKRSPRKNDPIDNFTKERELSRLREAQEIFKERKIQEAIDTYGPPKGMEVENQGEEMMEQEGQMMPPSNMPPGMPPGMSPEMMGQQMPPEALMGQMPTGMAYGGFKMYQQADPILRDDPNKGTKTWWEEEALTGYGMPLRILDSSGWPYGSSPNADDPFSRVDYEREQLKKRYTEPELSEVGKWADEFNVPVEDYYNPKFINKFSTPEEINRAGYLQSLTQFGNLTPKSTEEILREAQSNNSQPLSSSSPKAAETTVAPSYKVDTDLFTPERTINPEVRNLQVLLDLPDYESAQNMIDSGELVLNDEDGTYLFPESDVVPKMETRSFLETKDKSEALNDFTPLPLREDVNVTELLTDLAGNPVGKNYKKRDYKEKLKPENNPFINKNILQAVRATPVASNLLAAALMPPPFKSENYLVQRDSSIIEKPDITPILSDINKLEAAGRNAMSSRASSTGELLAGLSNVAALGMAEVGKARNQQYQDWIAQINNQQQLNLQIAQYNSGVRQDVDSANAELQKQKLELINAAATEASKIADGMIQEGYTREEMDRMLEAYPYLRTYFSKGQ